MFVRGIPEYFGEKAEERACRPEIDKALAVASDDQRLHLKVKPQNRTLCWFRSEGQVGHLVFVKYRWNLDILGVIQDPCGGYLRGNDRQNLVNRRKMCLSFEQDWKAILSMEFFRGIGEWHDRLL